MSFIKTVALMRGGRIYTLSAWKDLDFISGSVRKSPFRWQGFCDGDRCGLFRSKSDFESFVHSEPDFPPQGPHAEATALAEHYSNYEGNRLLRKFRGKRR